MRVPIGIELQSSDVLNEMRLKAVSKERYINNAEVKSCSVSENFRLDSEFIDKYIKSVKVADLDSFIIYDTDNFSNILGFLNDSSVYFVKDKANEFITLSMGSDGGGCIALYCDGKLLSTVENSIIRIRLKGLIFNTRDLILECNIDNGDILVKVGNYLIYSNNYGVNYNNFDFSSHSNYFNIERSIYKDLKFFSVYNDGYIEMFDTFGFIGYNNTNSLIVPDKIEKVYLDLCFLDCSIIIPPSVNYLTIDITKNAVELFNIYFENNKINKIFIPRSKADILNITLLGHDYSLGNFKDIADKLREYSTYIEEY